MLLSRDHVDNFGRDVQQMENSGEIVHADVREDSNKKAYAKRDQEVMLMLLDVSLDFRPHFSGR